MEKKYYEINETTARRAHEMMSFSDYRENSTTAEYRRLVDEAYVVAERAAAKRPEREADIHYYVDRYALKLAENMNRENEIGTRCPSVMICGPANFPVRKKEKQVAAWDKNHQDRVALEKYLEKIRSIANGSEIILSNDAMAIQKLEDKLSDLKELQDKMVAANKAIRLKDTEAGNEQLRELGFSERQIEDLRTPNCFGMVGFAPYQLQNNNANIHRIEGRIKELKVVKAAGTTETSTDLFRVVKNTEAMRLQVFFEGKPDPEVREILKSNGFRWAPSFGCWQRQLTSNAEWALKRITDALSK